MLAQTRDSVPAKVSHAEPLYIDLVRDLGARKGEREFNLGSEMVRRNQSEEYVVLAEYEWAPIHRLGLEVETDFSFFNTHAETAEISGNKLDCIRLSAQYSFFVSTQRATTLAVGYTQLLELTAFSNYSTERLITGVAYNPFFVAAKRWGDHLHTLAYVAPIIGHELPEQRFSIDGQLNTSLHYVFTKRHAVGLECSTFWDDHQFGLALRPQVKIKLNQQLAIGWVVGIPVVNKQETFSSFVRIIYEPR